MSDDNYHSDPWNDAPSEDVFEIDEIDEEEAVFAPEPEEDDPMQDWNDETDAFSTEDDDVDESFYEPPAPPITDAELEPDEPSNEGGNWWRENWWRLAIIIFLLLAIIFLLARACTGKTTEPPIPTPLPIATQAALPTFTPTPAAEQGVEAVAPAPGAETESGAPGAETGATTETTPPPPPTVTPVAATGQFTIGQTVIVTGTGKDKLSFRAGPGTNYKRIRVVKDGVKLTVIGGPEEADGFTWWQLKAPNGQVGWAVEDHLTAAQ